MIMIIDSPSYLAQRIEQGSFDHHHDPNHDHWFCEPPCSPSEHHHHHHHHPCKVPIIKQGSQIEQSSHIEPAYDRDDGDRDHSCDNDGKTRVIRSNNQL